jgi:hypothetical protein
MQDSVMEQNAVIPADELYENLTDLTADFSTAHFSLGKIRFRHNGKIHKLFLVKPSPISFVDLSFSMPNLKCRMNIFMFDVFLSTCKYFLLVNI